jgi:hypothetical protein
MTADNKTETAQVALASARAARAQTVAEHLAANRFKPYPRKPAAEPVLEPLQRAAAERADKLWDPEEAADFGQSPTHLTGALIRAIETAEKDFGGYRVTPYFKGTYEEYLKTEHWIEMRDKMLLRAGGMCQRCERGQHLEVHHIHYRHLGAEREHDLIVLCHECHASEHGRNW